jgi:hypothetical protein
MLRAILSFLRLATDRDTSIGCLSNEEIDAL